jgi:hypothetical protein
MRKILILAALMLTTSLAAQENTGDEQIAPKVKFEKQHSLEITTGYPSIVHNLEYPWAYASIKMHSRGQKYQTYYQPGINIGYTFQWSKRWEVNAMANIHLTIMDIDQYPQLPGTGTIDPTDPNSSDKFDWNANPTRSRQTDVYGAFCAAVRFKWIVRENFSMYSALGAGLSLGFPIPLPYIAPVGIQFGKGRVYGIVEANISAATTFGIAGIGVRL